MARSRFSFRAFTSLILFWMFVTLLTSGIVLFVAPPGRVAHWSGRQLRFHTKEQWQAVHTLSSVAFLIGGLFHFLKFNRNVIWTYVKRSRQAVAPFRGVVASATLVSALVVFGTMAGWPPFSLVMDLSESATESWESPAASPPVPHAEELPVGAILSSLGVDLEAGRAALAEAGIELAGLDQTLLDVATASDLTPAEIYSQLRAIRPAGSRTSRELAPGAGLGRKTIEELASEKSIGLEAALARLEGAGLEARPDETLRDVADRAGVTPSEVYGALVQPGQATTDHSTRSDSDS